MASPLLFFLTNVCLTRIDVKMRIDHWYDPMKLKNFLTLVSRYKDDYVCSQIDERLKIVFFLLILCFFFLFFTWTIHCAVVIVLTICSSLSCICRLFVFFSSLFSLRIALTMFIQCMYYSYSSIIVNDIHCVCRWCIVYQNLLYFSSISFFTWKNCLKNSWELLNCSLLLLSCIVNALVEDEPGPLE